MKAQGSKNHFDGADLDKRFAYTAIVNEGKGKPFILGIAERGTAGYTPRAQYQFDSWGEATAKAEEMNAELGVDRITAADIVVETLRNQNLRGA